MSRRFDSHLFWGSYSPLSALTGSALIIMASSRFAFAIVCAAALIWVYGFTALVSSVTRRIMPSRGKMTVLLFLSTFLCAIFILLTGMLNPLIILGTSFFLLLIPPCCLGAGYFEELESVDHGEAVSRALLEAITLGAIILAFALIREPLSMGTLTFPGGPAGITELFNVKDSDAFVLLPAFSVSAGGLLLLGYATAIYRYFGENNGGISNNDDIAGGKN